MSRALVVIRLSVLADSSTSPERQLEHCQSAIAARGWELVGTARDLDVSATKFSPFQRPELGPWLTDTPPAAWDTLVVWRLDRLVRSSKDLSDLLSWCQERGKGVLSATEGFDLSTPFGKAMVTIIAALGELEANTVRDRVLDAHRALRTTDRLPSGVPPFGFVPTEHPSGHGVGLVKDPDMQSVLHDMASWLLSGWTLSGIMHRLNNDGIQTAKDRSRVRNGAEPRGSGWQTWIVRAALQSPATQGWKMVGGALKGKPALDADGQMIRVASPSFDDDTWEQLQERLKERTSSGKQRVNSSNPMLGIGVCGVCGHTLAQMFTDHKRRNHVYRYYRCSGKPKCPRVSIRAEQADAILEAGLLAARRGQRVTEKVFVPGTDNRTEIEAIRSSLGRLRAESDAGLVLDEDEYMRRLTALTGRLRELEREPYKASGWERREREETYADAWAVADDTGRRQLLRDADAKLRLFPGGEVDIEIGKDSYDA